MVDWAKLMPEAAEGLRHLKKSWASLRSEIRLAKAQRHLDAAHAIYLREKRFDAMLHCIRAMTAALRDPT